MRSFLLPCFLAISLASARSESSLALHLLDLSGRKAGICSMPRCGDGKLAVELARESKLLVHAMNEKPAEVAMARKAADEAGLLGRTLYVEEGGVSKNPLADWCADLLVIADASDADLAQVVQKDIRRVLSPYRGVAIVGRAKALGAGLSRVQLEAWLKGLDAPGGKIVEDDFGLWAIATMPPLAGGDDWTHYAHGPDQNRYSKDDVLKYPFVLQWTGKPYFDGKYDMVVAAGGRLIRANSKLGQPKPDGVTVRSAYNGQILWQRPLPDRFGGFGSLIVATPDIVYLKDGNGVLCLDAETGKEVKRLSLSDDPQVECRWLMLQDGVLVTILGPCPALKDDVPMSSFASTLPEERWGSLDGVFGTPEVKAWEVRMDEVKYHWFQGYDRGTALMAFDVTSGKKLWSMETLQIDPAKSAICGDRVYFYAARSYASCVNLKTGKTIWKTNDPIAKDPLGAGGAGITFMLTRRVAGLASPDVYLINSFKDGHYRAYSAKDGTVLWGRGLGRTQESAKEETELGGTTFPVLMNGKMIQKGGAFFDPLTGKPTGEKLVGGSWGGCGTFAVSKHGIHPMCGTSWDLDANAPISYAGELKAACLSGVVPADGLLFSGHGDCVGCAEWVGYQTFRSADGLALNGPISDPDRLVTGKAVDHPSRAATPQDWTTYRANNNRSGSSSVAVPSAAKLLWTWTPNPPFDYSAELATGLETPSTQSICVGDRVFFGTAAGVIRCLDRKTGNEVWNYPTAGRILSAPTFWEGKLYSGSGDGRVYCLNAQNGSLVWRYRVAPVERRIMVFSHLTSAWPVNANVLVAPSTQAGANGAVAYASAGLMGSAGGTYVCALDARTGKPLWETGLNDTAIPATESGKNNGADKTGSVVDTKQAGDAIPILPSGTGQMAWYKGNLWLHAGDSGLYIINSVTGKASAAIDINKIDNLRVENKDHIRWGTFMPGRGQDIGILPGGWVIFGGKEIYNASDQMLQPRNICAFLRAEPDQVPLVNGYPDLINLKWNGNSILPVWDDKETILTGYGVGNNKTGPVSCSGLADFFTTQLKATPFDPKKAANGFWNPGLRNSIVSDLPSDHARKVLPEQLKSQDFLTPLLADNAVVFCTKINRDWHVIAVNRTDSTLLWDVVIPAQPYFGGLSMTSAGDVLAPLVDGRVICIGGQGASVGENQKR